MSAIDSHYLEAMLETAMIWTTSTVFVIRQLFVATRCQRWSGSMGMSVHVRLQIPCDTISGARVDVCC